MSRVIDTKDIPPARCDHCQEVITMVKVVVTMEATCAQPRETAYRCECGKLDSFRPLVGPELDEYDELVKLRQYVADMEAELALLRKQDADAKQEGS